MEMRKTIKDKYIEKIFKLLTWIYVICIIVGDLMLNIIRKFEVYPEITIQKCSAYLILTLFEIIIILCVYFKNKDNLQKLKKNYKAIKTFFVVLTFINYILMNLIFPMNQFVASMPFFIILTILFLDKFTLNVSWCLGVVIELCMIFYKFRVDTINDTFKCEMTLRLMTMILDLGAVYVIGFVAIYCIDSADTNEKQVLSNMIKREETILKIKEESYIVAESSVSLLKASEESTLAMQNIMEECNLLDRTSREIIGSIGLNEKTLEEIIDYSDNMKESANIVKKSSDNIVFRAENDKTTMENLNDLACKIEEDISKTLNATQVLQKKSQEVDNVINIISTISEQTNLLSLNASIEAVRVGEAGKGFAVVAEQIRTLAEQSSSSISNISNIIKEYKEQLIQVEQFMKNNDKAVRESKELIYNIGSTLKDTLTDIKETGEQINTVFHNIETVDNNIVGVSSRSSEIYKSITNMSQQFEKVKVAVEDNTSISEEINASTEELNATAETLNNIAQR